MEDEREKTVSFNKHQSKGKTKQERKRKTERMWGGATQAIQCLIKLGNREFWLPETKPSTSYINLNQQVQMNDSKRSV